VSRAGPFFREVVHLVEVDSTSDHARRLLAAGGVALPLLVRADRQTAGRGRGRHAWWSDAGSLTFTVALDPAAHALRQEHEPRLALSTAVAVVEALERDGGVPAGLLGIRWPNDVEGRSRKLGGILPERVETPAGPRLLIGIGLNLITRLEDAPPEVRAMATTVAALRPAPGPPVDPSSLLDAILGRFSDALAALSRDDPSLAARWNALDLLADRQVRVDLGPRLVAGTGRGIDERGGLRLATEAGLVTLFGGQVLRD
jgi:BirA family transcriptional regulator, biotin operon repressor / biotin---[acetyl-CoA-carboxylase] ligase